MGSKFLRDFATDLYSIEILIWVFQILHEMLIKIVVN